MWDPQVYLKFASERGRPFHDLIGRIRAVEPRSVVDLGCGPGNLTQTLAQRWPGAAIKGVDASPEMIAAAPVSTVRYEVGDLREYVPTEDVIVTNATLQWVDGHDELLQKWAAPGRWIAMQVPANFDAPSHLLLRELAPEHAGRRTVGDAVHYARVFRAAGCVVDAWETTYIHQLPLVEGARHPVLTWMSGTALNPVRTALSEPDFAKLCDELEAGLWKAYPAHDSVVDFPFLRVFAVAYRER
ncbi:methyltransferase domain-containing protein [Allorhizocola rhizosphaerae]|uniref:methyltransferase domain-containing protein n=1 Tax=Allorhizocola rhizosphaerae TaxID=1872709 RepID=UPI000E3BCC7B|nr:methyltransferase domain-containing protein [Allorhizocola rhizosphaerae]